MPQRNAEPIPPPTTPLDADAAIVPPDASRIPRRPALDFSLTGLIYCSMMMFMGLAAMNTQANLLFGVFGLMVGLLFISWILSRIVLQKLKVHRNFPEHGVAGERMTVYYEITNQKRFWPSLSVCVAELDNDDVFNRQPQGYMLHAAPGMTATVPVEVTPQRRGLHHLEQYQLSTSFPFGFVRRAALGRHKEVVCIYPALAEVDHRVLEMCRSADNTGESTKPRSGGMDEFYGVREYRPGDSPRHIYWRRSARTGVLVSKDMTRVSPPRLMLLVDTYLGDPSVAGRGLVERVIAMAASLASVALERELAVGVRAWAGEPVSMVPTRGKQQRKELLSLLARLPENTTYTGDHLLDGGEWMLKSGTTLVMLTPRAASIDMLLRRRGGIVTLSASSDGIMDLFRFRPEVKFDPPIPPEPPTPPSGGIRRRFGVERQKSKKVEKTAPVLSEK